MTARYPLVINGTQVQELQSGDTLTGQAASGANSDITSLTGLTTALSVPQGGSGAATLTGVLKGNGTSAFSAATAGTDYLAPSGALGTPSSGVLTNATGLPISTGVSGLGTGVATFLATPSSANLISAVTDETGTGSLVFATSPTLVTPALGTPSALVGTNITGTASGLTAGNVTTNANLTGAVTSVGNATSLGSFSSSNLAGALTDKTGSGSAVFATSPTLVTPILGTPTSATLTNATGLPILTGVSGLGTGVATALAVNVGSAGAPLVNGGVLGTPSSGTATNLTGLPISTGVSGLGTGVATFLATPSSANLLAALTDETGTGSAVFATSPTLVTPILGTPTSATLTNATGLPLTTGVTGVLPIANGGTNATTAANALTSLGAYPATNPSGYTTNTGTVTSVSGTGTVSGLTITGTVTTSGNLTLGGTLSVTNANTTATNLNTASAIVARDASGNFSAGTITASLSGNATTSSSCTGNAATATNATTATTATTANATATGNNFQMNSLGVGTGGSGTAGEVRATNNVTAFYSSDIKFKENVRDIPNALNTVNAIGGKLFDWKDDYIQSKGGADGYFVQKADFGVIAQDVQKVFPIAIRTREDGSLAVDYEKLGVLAFSALIELTKRVEALEAK